MRDKSPDALGISQLGVDSAPQSLAATVQPVKIHFAKDLAAAFGVTVTYYEPFEKDGKKLARKKELKSKLGETVKFMVNVPSIVIFEVGFGNGGGKFTAEPGCKYIARKGGLLGTKWQVSEVDQIWMVILLEVRVKIRTEMWLGLLLGTGPGRFQRTIIYEGGGMRVEKGGDGIIPTKILKILLILSCAKVQQKKRACWQISAVHCVSAPLR